MIRAPKHVPLLSAAALVMGLVVLPAAPALAHPEACAVTDDASVEQCLDEGKASDGSGESVFLDGEAPIFGSGSAGVFSTSKNMHGLGFSERSVPVSGAGSGVLNSDLAFSGKTAIQGTFQGFRLIDITEPEAPREIVNYADCVKGTLGTGGQGDIVVLDDVLVRSWDAPRATAQLCGDVATPAGTEGVHIFDISDPTKPDALSFVPLPCGSHTASGIPDPANGRLLVYSSPSSSAAACRGIDIISVPLSNPGAAKVLGFVDSGDRVPAFPNVVAITTGTATGTYGAEGAQFGPVPTAAGLAGPVVVASPLLACGPIAPVVSGSIVVVERGVCGFAVKVLNAQNAGAGAVIVGNDAPGAPFTMRGVDPTIEIPSVMVSQADGVKIRTGAPSTGSIRAAQQPATPARPCHDTGIILGDVLRAACAGGNGVTMFSLDPAEGGSLEKPKMLYSRTLPGVTIGHSASFTWDGKVLVYGHEPGGGVAPECQATSPAVNRTLYFLDTETGNTVGTFINPRPQTATENCTWHNYNVVPTDKGYVMVSGNYQSGISVIDFTNPASPREVGFADPKPLSTTSLVTGGDWSTYWYDGHIYQSDIRRGLLVWKLSDPAVAGAKKLGHLNPQTQETSFALKRAGR